MTTFTLVGAGPGLGLAGARRFGAAGHKVALLSRSAEHLGQRVAELTADGVQVRDYTADVRNCGMRREPGVTESVMADSSTGCGRQRPAGGRIRGIGP
ncbi:hypothetical protein GCM10027162_05500 [Streptomyces incanus]